MCDLSGSLVLLVPWGALRDPVYRTHHSRFYNCSFEPVSAHPGPSCIHDRLQKWVNVSAPVGLNLPNVGNHFLDRENSNHEPWGQPDFKEHGQETSCMK